MYHYFILRVKLILQDTQKFNIGVSFFGAILAARSILYENSGNYVHTAYNGRRRLRLLQITVSTYMVAYNSYSNRTLP